MTRSVWHDQHDTPPITCDVVIVGGGILGTSTAYWLNRVAPHKNVVLIEAEELAHGASGRNAGFILQGASSDIIRDVEELGSTRATRVLSFTCENRNLLFSEVDQDAVSLNASGSLVLAGDEKENTRLRKAVSLLRSHGIKAEHYSIDAIYKRIGARGFRGGLFLPTGAMVNPVRLVRYLAYHARALCLERCSMLGYCQVPNGSIEIQTSKGQIHATNLILCCGAQIGKYVADADQVVRPVRAQMLASRPLRQHIDLPIYSHEGHFYVRQTESGNVLAGGARHLHRDDEVGFDDQVTRDLQGDIEGYLSRHFPSMEDLKVIKRWSGTMGFSSDGLPVIARLSNAKNSFWMGGCTGHGMAYGFRLGLLMARRLAGKPDDYDSEFSASRFD